MEVAPKRPSMRERFRKAVEWVTALNKARMLVVALLAVSAASTSVAVGVFDDPPPPVCARSYAVSGDVLVNRDSHRRTGPYGLNAEPGTYRLIGVSADVAHVLDHPQHRRQPNEQWHAIFDGGGWRTHTTPDLPDWQGVATFDLGTVTLDEGAAWVEFWHAGTGTSSGSVLPAIRLECVG